MRKILISVLLTGAAASPALAQDQGNGRWHHDQQQSDRGQAHEERQQQRAQARAERSDGGANVERVQRAQSEGTPPPPEARQQVQEEGHRGGFDRARFERENSGPRVVEAPEPSAGRPDRGNWLRDRGDGQDRSNRHNDGAQQPGGPDGSIRDRSAAGDRSNLNNDRVRSGGPSGWTRTQNGWTRVDGDLRQSDRPVPNVMRTRNPLIVSDTPREGTQPPLRSQQRRWSSINWNTSWRHDGRYDWHGWRNRHRSLFHIGIYYDPFGWGYRPYEVGWRLWPSYYGRQYWIDEPYQYRLPYAPPGTVWIRYWDDALLIDTWSGEVVDVIHNFFW
jgi:hypothetical protein